MVFFHLFGLRWVPNFGVYHIYSWLTCFNNWLCILKTLPHMCISHALFMHTHLLPLSCLGLYLISSSLACYVYFMFCRIFFLRCFAFCLSSISHSSCTPHASLPLFISSFLSFLPFDPFVYLWQKGGEYCHFYMTLVHILRRRNSILCTFVGGEIP